MISGLYGFVTKSQAPISSALISFSVSEGHLLNLLYPSDSGYLILPPQCSTPSEYQMFLHSYFYQLLDDIYPKLQSVSEHIKYTSADAAIEYIENNYNKDISVSTLAKLCKCSESGFFKMFKNSTGVTPVSYKQNVMIQHSLELLAHTNLSIEEISTRVGFSSSNYFRTVFFKLTGKTPKELR